MRFRLLVDDRLMALIKVDGFNQECTRIEAKIQIPSLSETLPQPLHVLQPKAASGALSFVNSVLRPWLVRHPTSLHLKAMGATNLAIIAAAAARHIMHRG